MLSALTIFLFITGVFVQPVRPEDGFNYRSTEERNFGPADWGKVQCDNIANCPGWPTNWDALGEFIPYDTMSNQCLDCSASTTGDCKTHKQSPINLYKSVTAIRPCRDWHRMHFNKGNCRFGGMRFEILPHVLRAYQPKDGCQIDPCIDFSYGFPDEWLLRFTDISVPSQHTVEGKRFAGEVVMSHVLGVNKTNKEIGNVSWFLEEGDESDFNFFLELYIRRWQQVAKRTAEDCASCRRLKETGGLRGSSHVGARSLSTIPVDEVNVTEPLPMQILRRSYFDFDFQFHPYEWYIQGGTHYYFRYEGSMPEPPCPGTAHWRVMRLPIRVAPSQIRALEALIAERIDPVTCQAYTAGRPRGGNSTAVDVNRPLQTNRGKQKLVYCECQDWESNLPLDQEYCSLSTEERGVFIYS